MNFTKMQGTGNDFILVETSDMQRDWSPVAITMCDRHFGVGADGLLLLLPSDSADFRMRIFNADGSEAEACGNGLRCLAKYVLERGLISPGAHQVLVETPSGMRKFELHKISSQVANIQVGMGTPKFEARDVPVMIEPGEENLFLSVKSMLNHSVSIGGRALALNLISIGNPHAVYFCRHPVSDFPLSRLGPKVEQHKIFPNGVNFEVARVVSRRQVEARVWEKGVGETLACGSGACAIAIAAQLHGYIDNKVDIKLPGGVLQVEWDGTGEVFLSGSAEIVFTGEWPG